MSAYMERVRLRLLARKEETSLGCWEWLGALDQDSYGISCLHSKTIRAHRLAYLAFVGPIPESMQIDHLCRNHKCINPKHLECVTSRENTIRGVGITAMASRATHCPRGHEYSKSNTYITPKGYRDCRACRQNASRKCRQLGRNKVVSNV